MDFLLGLGSVPAVCECRGQASDDHNTMTGRLSCLRGGIAVVSHDMTLARTGY